MSKENREKVNNLINNISKIYEEYNELLLTTYGNILSIRAKLKPKLKQLENAKIELIDYLNNRIKSIDNLNEFSMNEILALLYPYPDDEFFNLKLQNHLIMKQYEDTQNVKELVEKLYSTYTNSKSEELIVDVNKDIFILQSFQKILKNYIGPKSIYNGILVVHGTGVGKTCTGITMAEGLKEFVDLSKKKIHLLRADEFERQIFEINKVKDGKAQLQCTGRTYVDLLEKQDKFKEALVNCQKGFEDECKVFKRGVKKELKKYYNFTTYMKWATSIGKTIYTKTRSLSELEAHKKKIEIIRKEFNNSVIIIDEAHNLRNEKLDDESGFKVTRILEDVILYSQNMKLILLSATPMYNEPSDIIQLLNYLLMNDNRPRLEKREIFTESEITKKGEKILRKYSTGYVSYIRGNDPIRFPLRLDADVNVPELIIKKYPTYNLFNEKLTDDKKVKHLKIVGCELDGKQLEVIEKSMSNLQSLSAIKEASNDLTDYSRESKLEKDQPKKTLKELFGNNSSNIKSLQSSNIKKSKSNLKSSKLNNNSGLSSFSRSSQLSKYLGNSVSKKMNKLNNNDLEELNELGIDDLDDAKLSVALCKELQMSTFVYQSLRDASGQIEFTYGKNGFQSVLQKMPKGNTYEFTNEDYAKQFMGANLKKYGAKIYQCLKSIEKVNGPTFVYGFYKFGSILPMAIALELMGYSRYDGIKPLIESKYKKEPNGLEYIIYTGDSEFTTSKEKRFFDLRGEMVKNKRVRIILATKKGSEGLNLFGFRELHILDPWHHINLLEQTIGRVIRTYSHQHLQPEHRNATIYMYSTIFPKSSKFKNRETYDLHDYAICEGKAIGSGKVENILRNNAIDCMLNKPINQRRKTDYNKPVEIITSHNKKIKHNFYDMPYTKNTLYLPNSEYTCFVEERNKPQLFKKIESLGPKINKTINKDISFYNLELRELIEKIILQIKKNYNLQYEDLIKIVKSATLNIRSSFGIRNINSILEYIIAYFNNNSMSILINNKEHYIVTTKLNGKYLLRLLPVDNFNPKLAIGEQKEILHKFGNKLDIIQKHDDLLHTDTKSFDKVDKVNIELLFKKMYKQKQRQISKTQLNYKDIMIKIKKSTDKIIFGDELVDNSNNELVELNDSGEKVNKIEFKTNLNLTNNMFVNEIYQVIFDRLLPIEKKFLLQNLVNRIKHYKKLSKLERIMVNLVRYNLVNTDEIFKDQSSNSRDPKFIYYEDYLKHPEKLYGFLYYNSENLMLYKFTKYNKDEEDDDGYDINNFFVEDKIKLNTLTSYRWKIMENQTPNLLFGFINYKSKTQIGKFKIMDYLEHGTFVKSVKGFECLSKLSNDLFKYIEKIEPKYKSYIKENQKNKKYLCGNLELLLRHYTNKDDDLTNPFIKRYFFNPEEYEIYQMYQSLF